MSPKGMPSHTINGLFRMFNSPFFFQGYSKSSLKYFLITTGAVLGGWIITSISVVTIALILDFFNKTMSWYANPWLIVGLYMLPTVALSGSLLVFISHKVNRKQYLVIVNYYDVFVFQNLSLKVTSQFQVHIVRLIWTVVLLIGTILSIRSVYAFVPTVFLNSLAFILIYSLKLHHTSKYINYYSILEFV